MSCDRVICTITRHLRLLWKEKWNCGCWSKKERSRLYMVPVVSFRCVWSNCRWNRYQPYGLDDSLNHSHKSVGSLFLFRLSHGLIISPSPRLIRFIRTFFSFWRTRSFWSTGKGNSSAGIIIPIDDSSNYRMNWWPTVMKKVSVVVLGNGNDWFRWIMEMARRRIRWSVLCYGWVLEWSWELFRRRGCYGMLRMRPRGSNVEYGCDVT